MPEIKRFGVTGSVTVAVSPGATCLSVKCTSVSTTPSIFYIAIGTESATADNQLEWLIQRFTADGTATSTTPQDLSGRALAAITTANKTYTVEPTYTAGAVLWRMGLNQRAAHSLVFDPDGWLTAPFTANNGMGLIPIQASATPTASATIHFHE